MSKDVSRCRTVHIVHYCHPEWQRPVMLLDFLPRLRIFTTTESSSIQMSTVLSLRNPHQSSCALWYSWVGRLRPYSTFLEMPIKHLITLYYFQEPLVSSIDSCKSCCDAQVNYIWKNGKEDKQDYIDRHLSESRLSFEAWDWGMGDKRKGEREETLSRSSWCDRRWVQTTIWRVNCVIVLNTVSTWHNFFFNLASCAQQIFPPSEQF